MCGSRLSSLVSSGTLGKVSGDTSLSCIGCKLGKQLQLPYPTSQTMSVRPFDLVHSDVWGPAPFVSKWGHRYYVIFIDDFSRFTWVYFLDSSAQVLTAYQSFTSMVHTQFDSPVFFMLTLLASICLALFVSFLWSRVLFLSNPAPVLTLRMVLLSVSTVTCLRLLGPYYWPPLLLLSSGLKLSLQLSTS